MGIATVLWSEGDERSEVHKTRSLSATIEEEASSSSNNNRRSSQSRSSRREGSLPVTQTGLTGCNTKSRNRQTVEIEINRARKEKRYCTKSTHQAAVWLASGCLTTYSVSCAVPCPAAVSPIIFGSCSAVRTYQTAAIITVCVAVIAKPDLPSRIPQGRGKAGISWGLGGCFSWLLAPTQQGRLVYALAQLRRWLDRCDPAALVVAGMWELHSTVYTRGENGKASPGHGGRTSPPCMMQQLLLRCQ